MKRLIALALFLLNYSLNSQILSQWRGPERDGHYPQENLLASWPSGGPQLLWKGKELGEGYSSPAVTADAVYVTGLVKKEGFLFAFNHAGKLLWKTSYGPEWDAGHPGARTTPTIVADRIYLVSGMGIVVCMTTDGKIQWQVDMQQRFSGRNLEWGITESPLIDGAHLFCTPGGAGTTMAALDRLTGKTIWQTTGNGQLSAYCSPRMMTHYGRRIILTMTEKSLIGIDADNGALLWQHPHVTRYDINPNTPLYADNMIYSISGYGTGGQMFQLSADGKSIKKLWENKAPDSQFGGAVLVNGSLYASGHENRGWACLDWKSGATQWTSREFGGKGAIIFSDGKLYLYSERGDVLLANPNPKQFETISSYTIAEGTGPHWAHPVIHNGRLYIRHGDTLFAYNIERK